MIRRPASGMLRRSLGLLTATVTLVLAAPALAQAAYSGSVSTGDQTVTLAGSGPVAISTGGGLLHHGDLGPGFADGNDFDSSQPGDQTVPDTGGWTVDVTGGGHDSLNIDEGEATNPVSYAFGHSFYPGGIPCVVRDPHDRQGVVAFSMHPFQETDVCYPSGITSVSVRAGSHATRFGVLDTAAGIPLHLYGGPGDSTVTETANVPDDVGGYHEPASPVYFTGGSGKDTITLEDGPVTAAASYTIGAGAIARRGLPPLYYRAAHAQLVLYPQSGPAKVTIGPTGGLPVQILGNFLSQTGPDRIDGTDADAPLYITGSLGDDTVLGGPVSSYIDGGGGNDTITTRNDVSDQVNCATGTATTVYADTRDVIGSHCLRLHRAKPVLPLHDVALVRARVRHGARLALGVPIYASGQLVVGFARASCPRKGICRHYVAAGTATVTLAKGTHKVSLGPRVRVGQQARALARGTYRLTVQLRSHGLKSAPVHLRLVVL